MSELAIVFAILAVASQLEENRSQASNQAPVTFLFSLVAIALGMAGAI